MEIQLHCSGWKPVQLGWNSNQTVKAAVFYFPYFAHDLFLWQLGDLLNNKNFDTSLAHSCTRFPCYLGMEINQCKDPMNNNKDCRFGQLTRYVPKEKMAFVSKSYFHILHSMVYNEHEICRDNLLGSVPIWNCIGTSTSIGGFWMT